MELLAGSCARIIKRGQCVLVEVNGSKCLVYEYVGPVKGFKEVKVLLSWQEDHFGAAGKAKGFLSADAGPAAEESLNHYDKRWIIEVYYKSMKEIGFDKYQIRHIGSIENLLWVYALLQCICVECLGEPHAFNEGFELLQTEAGLAELREMFDFARCSGFDEFCSLYRQ
jgi:hypothetical protein